MKILIAIVIGLAFQQSFYKTPSGTKYHLASCRMVENVSEKITKEQAIEMGLGPCSICRPANIHFASISNAANKAQGEDKGKQCLGTTKAGSRCRHYTRIGNGYCYQHQPKRN